MLHWQRVGAGIVVAAGVALEAWALDAEDRYRSHPPLRRMSAISDRPLAPGPVRFVDPENGRDQNPGTREEPWRTINHALTRLAPGDTLCLRGGVYCETVYCAVSGTPDAPVTIRGYPGEQAIIDGGFPEFQRTPQTAWIPAPDGVPGEYLSAQSYPNIRDVTGLFADSHIGLQTYWYAEDLRAANELWIHAPDAPRVPAPVYCGPGIWYDRATGRIHARLAHTELPSLGSRNYRGATDPRTLPLVISRFQAVPLFVDLGRHLRFRDLLIRGGGYRTVQLQFAVDVSFDNCTIVGGTYCIWAKNSGPVAMTHCGVHGSIPPWGFMQENSLHTYKFNYYTPFLAEAASSYLEAGTPASTPAAAADPQYDDSVPANVLRRGNIARLNTHALLVMAGGYEFEVFYTPLNHDWDISYCDFTDGHDGIYPAGRKIRFHHNRVDQIQDDGIYLSSPTPYVSHDVHIFQNLLTRMTIAFGAHARGGPRGDIYIYRNVVSLPAEFPRTRPTPSHPAGKPINSTIFLRHGREVLGGESIHWYHNTLSAPGNGHCLGHYTLALTTPDTRRRVYNNIFVYGATRSTFGGLPAPGHEVLTNGNLHWSAASATRIVEQAFAHARTALQSRPEAAAGGCEENSLVANPAFTNWNADYTDGLGHVLSLTAASPAVGTGVTLPADLPDPLRRADSHPPDIGAVPFDAEEIRVGRHGRDRLTNPAAGSAAHPPAE